MKVILKFFYINVLKNKHFLPAMVDFLWNLAYHSPIIV